MKYQKLLVEKRNLLVVGVVVLGIAGLVNILPAAMAQAVPVTPPNSTSAMTCTGTATPADANDPSKGVNVVWQPSIFSLPTTMALTWFSSDGTTVTNNGALAKNYINTTGAAETVSVYFQVTWTLAVPTTLSSMPCYVVIQPVTALSPTLAVIRLGTSATPDPTASNPLTLRYTLTGSSGAATIVAAVTPKGVFSGLKTWSFATQVDGDRTINWNGLDNSNNPLPSGDYNFLVYGQDGANSIGEKSVNFTITRSTSSGASGSTGVGTGSTGTAPSGAAAGTASSSSGASASTGAASTGTGTGASSSGSSSTTPTAPAPDIISCTLSSDQLILSQNQNMVMSCFLKPPAPPANLTVRIVKNYTPPQDPSADSIVRDIVYQQNYVNKFFSFNWSGRDNYDQPAADGDYSFVVWAQQNSTDTPKVSIHNFHVLQIPPVQTQETVSTPVAPVSTPAPVVVPPAPPAPPKPSKCPGVNYPKDIDGHWAMESIKTAYDLCIFASVKFSPDASITRFDALKSAMIALNIVPDYGCRKSSCMPFIDVTSAERPWVAAAWEAKVVSGFGRHFKPKASITREQSAALLVKIFKIPPHQGCYSSNCGAGWPNNLFTDIADSWAGPYLRPLWDFKIIGFSGENRFFPDRFTTRAEWADFLVKLMRVKR